MKSPIKLILSAILLIMLNACAHYSSYPSYGGVHSGGYVVQRRYYGATPRYYPPPRFQFYTRPVPPPRFYGFPVFPHHHWQYEHRDHDDDHHWEHHDDHDRHGLNPQNGGEHGFNHPNWRQPHSQGFDNRRR